MVHSTIEAAPHCMSVEARLLSRLCVAALVLLVLPACDSSSFTPERPPELGGATGSSPGSATRATASVSAPTGVAPSSPTGGASARSRLVETIYRLPPDADRLFLAQFLRRDTGLQRTAFRLTAPENNKPFSDEELAKAIRASADRSTGALIVEAGDGPQTRQAILDVQAQGLPVILLDQPLSGPALPPGKTIPYISLRGFEDGAEKLIAAVTEDAKLFRMTADSEIVVLRNRQEDFYSNRRRDAIAKALEAKGLKFEVLTFDHEQDGAVKALSKYITEHPKLGMVFVDDEYGVTGAVQAVEERKQKVNHDILVGGFAPCDTRFDNYVKSRTQALVNRNTDGFSRKLLEIAFAMMEQKPVPDHVEVDMPFLRNEPAYYPIPAEPDAAKSDAAKTESTKTEPAKTP